MSPKKPVSMRKRRIITFSVIGALTLGTIGFFGFPRDFSDQLASIPEVIKDAVAELEAKPVTIFDPPKYSLEAADSIWVVVNKQRPISPLRYKPEVLTRPSFENPTLQNPYNLRLREEASLATSLLATAMKEAGKGTLILNSGFRTYKTQKALYERTKAARGLAVAEKLSARPGFSEHQTGLAADFSAAGQGCVIMVCFGKTEAGVWLRKNAHKYGFIIRYPAKMSEVTGFQYEPWHFRYVGVELATELRTKGIKTLEEFWGIPAAPDYSSPAG